MRKALGLAVVLMMLVTLVAACGPTPEPQTIVQTVEVEKTVVETVEVEKTVVETVEVEKEVTVVQTVEAHRGSRRDAANGYGPGCQPTAGPDPHGR